MSSSDTVENEYLVCYEKLLCTVFGWSGIGVLYAAVLPIGIYFTHKFYQYRQHPALQVRYPEICIFSATTCLVHAFIAEQYYYMQRIFMTEEALIVLWISKLILPPLFLLMAVSIVFRFWIIHYNIRYAISQEKNDWQTLLAGDASIKRDWYDRHVSTYGNWKFVKRYFITYTIIGAVSEIAVVALQHHSLLNLNPVYASLTYLVFLVPLFVFSAFLVCRTPAFEDSFFMRKEMKYLSAVAVIGFVIYLPSTVLYAAGELFYWLTVSALTFTTFGFVITMTAMVLREVARIDPHMDRYKNMRVYSFATAKKHLSVDPNDVLELMRNISKFGDRVAHANGDGDLRLSYKQLFNILIFDDVGVNMLFTHLHTEFAVENLMGFIELIQFIRNVTDSQLADGGQYNLPMLNDLRYEFASSVPVTACNAVYDAEDDNWWAPMQLIYKKHISVSAQYQLNLPFDLRQRFTRLMQLLEIKLQVQAGTYVLKNRRDTIKSQSRKETFSFWRRFTRTETTPAHDQQIPSQAQYPDVRPTAQSVPDPANVIMEEYEQSPVLGAVQRTTSHRSSDSHRTETQTMHFQHMRISTLPALQEQNINTPISDSSTPVTFHRPQHSTPTPAIAASTEVMLPMVSTRISRIRSRSAPNDTAPVPAIKRNSSIFDSFVSMILTRGSSIKPTPRTPRTEHDEQKSEPDVNPQNAAYLEEMKEIVFANKITKKDLVAVSCAVIGCILQLNYQSVSRFKRTPQFQRFRESVNLKHLLHVLEDKNAGNGI